MKIYLAALWFQTDQLNQGKNDRRLFSFHFLKDVKEEEIIDGLKSWKKIADQTGGISNEQK